MWEKEGEVDTGTRNSSEDLPPLLMLQRQYEQRRLVAGM